MNKKIKWSLIAGMTIAVLAIGYWNLQPKVNQEMGGAPAGQAPGGQGPGGDSHLGWPAELH